MDLDRQIDIHLDKQQHDTGDVNIMKALNLSKKKKNVPPLNEGFVKYFAFKTQENKMKQQLKNDGKLEEHEDDWLKQYVDKPAVRVKNLFSEFVFDKNFAKASHHITE